MKIDIQNFGPIHHFEFDLEKDLHLLYGKNNVGKSYAVNVLYCFLKSLSAEKNYDQTKSKDREETTSEKNPFIASLRNDFEKFFIPEFKRSLSNTYYPGNIRNRFTEKNSVLTFKHKYFSISLEFDNNWVIRIKNIEEKFGKNVSIKDQNKDPLLSLFEIAFEFKELKEKLLFLPASKSGLYNSLSGMGELLAELSRSRKEINSKIELPPFSEAVSDYTLKLFSIESNDGKRDTITSFGTALEKILGGEVYFNVQNKKIYFQPFGKNFSIHISEAATMVSELAPLVLFLKYVLSFNQQGNVLIIEEPEAHLHPEVQVQLTEIFVALAKHKVKVILTSHSNYLFNKLSNMLLKKEIEPEKVAVYHLLMREKGSIIAGDMQATEEGIEDENFSQVAEDLYNERLETYEKLNQQADASR